MTNISDGFELINWQGGSVVVGTTTLSLHNFSENSKTIGNSLLLYKTKALIDQYQSFFCAKKSSQYSNILEIGIWGHGSVVLWNEIFKPNKYVAIDIKKPTSSSNFVDYLAKNNLSSKIKTFWEFDQGDKLRIKSLCDSEFSDGLDLVLDDGSHLYGYTLACFEAVFPRLREGGLYIIEDWAWEHWSSYNKLLHPWALEKSLTLLVNELTCAAGSANELISNIYICKGFVAVQRGALKIPPDSDFGLSDYCQQRSFRYLRSLASNIFPSIRWIRKFYS